MIINREIDNLARAIICTLDRWEAATRQAEERRVARREARRRKREREEAA